MRKQLIESVSDYYSGKLANAKSSHEAVDWNSEAGQILRFEKLVSQFKDNLNDSSINDYGCGTGKFAEWSDSKFTNLTYCGCDVSGDMVSKASSSHGDRFTVGTKCDKMASYGVASGIFNVMLNNKKEEWKEYIFNMLETINSETSKGFAVNFLTSYSDKEFMRDDLYYADPSEMFDHCMRKFSRKVSLIHDYELYEFSISVIKS
ncbi:UNVERIFIED_CONTAM: hypothetical protein GTU68_030181 [Idotea baltica]|nr:hypothetical protein [Idotea baltica]